MGGQGKTTLARKVYEKVIGDFHCHAWITVPQVYSIQDLLWTMWKKFDANIKEVPEMGLESLTEELSKYLRQKRYVVFFDDVWNKEFWSDIESAVLDNKIKSRIVITTRSMEVAELCKIHSIVHILNLQPLSLEQSLKLFYKKAFQNEPDGICPTGLESISLKIVEKCNGLPLAIVAIAGLSLCKEKNSREWQKFCQTLNYELDKNPNSTSITNILGLSYDVLPYYLKPCFLYFGIYPEDYEVESERLIRLWIAEGFVKSDGHHETLEEVAERYLKQLVQRSLVQASSFSIDGKPTRCRVHDLLHDMILKKIKDIGFCHFVGDGHSMISGKIRRLQIATDSKDDYSKVANTEGSLIRSLHVFQENKLPEKIVRRIHSKYMRLKVFELDWLSYIPENLGNLIHLRYLSFRNGYMVKSLPESIGNLKNLETLDLRRTSVTQLPREINKLRKLRHLLVQKTKMMGGFEGLESLQTLYCVDTERWGEDIFKELEQLRQLRSFGVAYVGKKYISTLCCSINEMAHLEELYIHAWYHESIDLDRISPPPTLEKLHLDGKLERFPKWIPMYHNLVNLTLRFSKLTDDTMKSLMHIPNLLSLCLWNAYEGTTLHFENGMFQKLKQLDLRFLLCLNSIHIGEGALPLLKELNLYNISELKEVPFGIDHLNNLEVFCIESMAKIFVYRIRENVWIQNNVRKIVY